MAKFFKKIGKAVLGGVTLGLMGGHKSKGKAAVATPAPSPEPQAAPAQQYEPAKAAIRQEAKQINDRLQQSQQQTAAGIGRAQAGRIRGGVFGDEAQYNNPLNPRLG